MNLYGIPTEEQPTKTLPTIAPLATSTTEGVSSKISIRRQETLEKLKTGGLIGEKDTSQILDVYDSIKKFSTKVYNDANRKYFTPVKTYAEQGGFSPGSLLEHAQTNIENANKDRFDVLKGEAVGLIKGATAGYVDLTKPRDLTIGIAGIPSLSKTIAHTEGVKLGEYGELAAGGAEFISQLIPYVSAQRLLEVAAVEMIPKLIVAHPRLISNLIDVSSFIGVDQLSPEAFTLTEEEQKSGLTLAQKRAEIAVSDTALLSIFKLFGWGFSKFGVPFLRETTQKSSDILKEKALKTLESKITTEVISPTSAAESEMILNKIKNVSEETGNVELNTKLKNAEIKANNVIGNAREKNSVAITKEKYILGSSDLNKPSDLNTAIVSDVEQIPVKTYEDTIVENNAVILKSINPTVVASRIGTEQLSILGSLKNIGYKDFPALEAEAETNIGRMSGRDLISTDEMGNRGFRFAADGAIESSPIASEEYVKDKIKDSVLNYLTELVGVTGQRRSGRATIKDKALLKQLIKLHESNPKKLELALTAVDSMSTLEQITRSSDYILEMVSNTAYKELQKGGDFLLGGKISGADINSSIVKIIEKFKKTNGTYKDLAESVLSVFGKKTAGSNPFNTSNKLVASLGIVDTKELAIKIQGITGIKIFDTEGNSIITESILQKRMSQIAKESGATTPEKMVRNWEIEKTDRMSTDKTLVAEIARTQGEGEFLSLELATLENKLESSVGAIEKTQAGFVAIPSTESAVKFASRIEETFKDQRNFWNSIKQGLKDNMEPVNRAFKIIIAEPELDSALVSKYPKVVNDIIKIRGLERDSSEYGASVVQDMLKGDVTKEEYEIFRRIVPVVDYLITKGEGKNLPRDFTEKEVLDYLAELKPQMDNNPKVRELMIRHMRIMGSAKEDLQKVGWIPEDFQHEFMPGKREELTNYLRTYFNVPNLELENLYYPHNVLDYIKEKFMGAKWTPITLKKSFKPYLIKRAGSIKDISTEYDKVMMNYISAITFDVNYEKRARALLDETGIFLSGKGPWRIPKDDVKILMDSAYPDSSINKDLLPDSAKILYPKSDKFYYYQYERGNRVYRGLTTTEKQIKYFLENSTTISEIEEALGPRGGAVFREGLIIGPKKDMYLLPEEVYNRVKKLRKPSDPDLQALLTLGKPWMPLWKQTVTKWQGGLGWRLVNSEGDQLNVLIKQPTAFRKMKAASRIAYDVIAKNPEDLSKATRIFMGKLKEERILQSAFVTGEVAARPGVDLFSLPKAINRTMDNSSAILEITPKIASILDNLQRFEQGKPLRLVGADKYVKEMAKQGYVEEAIFAYGRGITVDYAAMPPEFRKMFSQSLTPFMFWFVRTGVGIAKTLKDSPWVGAVYSAFLAALEIWNNSPSNKIYEEGLSDFRRSTPHLILHNEDTKTTTYLNFDNPINQAFRIFGLQNTASTITKVVNGDLTPEQGATTFLGDVFMGPANWIQSMASPVIQALEGLLTNIDPFTKQKIVPENLLGTPVGNAKAFQIRAMWFFGKIFTPFGTLMSTSQDFNPSQNFEQFIMNAGSGWLQPWKRFVISYPDTELVLNNYIKGQRNAQAIQEIFYDDYLKAYLDGDSNKLLNMTTKVAEGKVEFITDVGLENFLTRDSTIVKILKDLQTKISDPNNRDQLERLTQLFQFYTKMKGTSEDTRNQLIQDMF